MLESYHRVIWDLMLNRSRLVLPLESRTIGGCHILYSERDNFHGVFLTLTRSRIAKVNGGNYIQESRLLFLLGESFQDVVAIYKHASFSGSAGCTRFDVAVYFQENRWWICHRFIAVPGHRINRMVFSKLWKRYDRTLSRFHHNIFSYGIPTSGEEDILFLTKWRSRILWISMRIRHSLRQHERTK